MLMMRGLRRPRFTQRPADADDARSLWAQVYADADDATSVRLMLMMRSLCGPRFTQRPADADVALPPNMQVAFEPWFFLNFRQAWELEARRRRVSGGVLREVGKKESRLFHNAFLCTSLILGEVWRNKGSKARCRFGDRETARTFRRNMLDQS